MQGKVLFDIGKTLYNGKGACFGCHGVNGDGIDAMGPTFWKSEWLLDDKTKLAKVMLHGLMGPINIGSRQWKTTAVMPGLAAREDISDHELAVISTYIRNSWGNTADTKAQVSVGLFKKIRKQTYGRQTPYSQVDIFPNRK